MRWIQHALRRAGIPYRADVKGVNGVDALRQLASGEVDMTVSLFAAAYQAVRGTGIYDGERLDVRGLALALHPGHNFFNFVSSNIGIRTFEEIPEKEPRLTLCVPPESAVVGRIVRSYMRHYGIDVDRDIERWGGKLSTGFHETLKLFLSGDANAVMREGTRMGAAGVISDLRDVVCLSLDAALATELSELYGTPVTVLEPGTLRGQDQAVVTLNNPGYVVLVRGDLPDEQVYCLARALNESSDSHAISEEIFYSVRHAGNTGAFLHGGAECYYRRVSSALP